MSTRFLCGLRRTAAASEGVELSRRYGVSLALASVGGFLEAYTYVTRNGVFANAQTGNIARMGLYLAQGRVLMTLRFLIPVVAFMIGVTLSMQLKRLRADWEELILCLELALLFLVGLIPPERLDVLATVTVSFVCALQVESFRKFGDNTFASTMCTGNLRIATENLNRYFETKNRALLHKSLQYYGIDLMFASAVLVGYWVTRALGTRAVWAILLIPAVLLVLLRRAKRREVQS